MNRNDPCACGSGKRYKHCHGRLEFTGPSALYREALAAHQSGLLRRAAELYRQAIEADPRDVDSLHMLGVVHFERRHYRESLELLWEAAQRTGWSDRLVRQNLGLLLAKLLTPAANARQEAVVAGYLAWKRAIENAPVAPVRVSVVLTVHEQAHTAARAIASVAAQTYPDVELIVVDDGSALAAAIADHLARLPLPSTSSRTERLGVARAANEGARRARGRHLAFLDADDAFAPERIEVMVQAMARATPSWGFSQVGYAGVQDAASGAGGEVARPRNFLAHDTPSFSLLGRDLIERRGNLFVERDLFLDLGGFRDTAHNCGWDFCIRAAQRIEPVVVPRELYLHGGRAPARATAARTTFLTSAEPWSAQLVADALASDATASNEFCPQFPANRVLLLRSELRAGNGDRIPVEMLRGLVDEWRARPVAETGSVGASPAKHTERVALVVLGMYRSGTSAVARVLNLCGAALPERVLAARLGINPKGFWEAEAVTDLDVRLLELLGGEWDRAPSTLPTDGPLVDEFLQNAREVLATEYADAAQILIKDPRICVLAPLWHRALQQAGYRPAYVVVVRHPLEVAGSLETQGDMPIAKGLDLWLDFTRRMEAFVEAGRANAVHIRYPELLDDWAGVVGRIARRLDVPLDLHARGGEVDRFLEIGMRNHRADDAGFEAAAAHPRIAEIRALHRRLLACCDRDR